VRERSSYLPFPSPCLFFGREGVETENLDIFQRKFVITIELLEIVVIYCNDIKKIQFSSPNFMEFNCYHKPIFSGRYLNFLSQHPLSQKRGTVMGMVDRSFFLSHPRFHCENLKYFITLLLENDYPLKFTFDTVNTRLKHLISHHKQQKK